MRRRGPLRRLFKPRRHRRHRAKDGAYIFIGPSAVDKHAVLVVDISPNGLAIVYRGMPEMLDSDGVLSLFSDETLYADGIPFETVYDRLLGTDDSLENQQIRRRGLRLKILGVLDKEQIRNFIKNNSSD